MELSIWPIKTKKANVLARTRKEYSIFYFFNPLTPRRACTQSYSQSLGYCQSSQSIAEALNLYHGDFSQLTAPDTLVLLQKVDPFRLFNLKARQISFKEC